MGNKAGGDNPNSKIIETDYKWSRSNTRLDTIKHLKGIEDTPGYIGCKRQLTSETKIQDELLICCVHQSKEYEGVYLTHLNLTKNKKGKLNAKYIKLGFSSTVNNANSCDMAQTSRIIAIPNGSSTRIYQTDHGTMDYTKNVHAYDEMINIDTRIRDKTFLENNDIDVTCAKLLKDVNVLTGDKDGRVRLWDIDYSQLIAEIQATENKQITSVDCVEINNKYFAVFGSINSKVYIRDPYASEYKVNDNNDNKDDGNWDDAVLDTTVTYPQELGSFNGGVNDVGFSKNGEFLAAISEDQTLEVYGRSQKYDPFWQSEVLEWQYLFNEKLPGEMVPTCLNWMDEETLIIGGKNTNILYFTSMKKREEDSETIKAIGEGVKAMIESIPDMKWMIGLCNTLVMQIEMYLIECDVMVYKYVFAKNNTNVTSISSCVVDEKLGGNVVVFYTDDGVCRSIISTIE